MPKASPRPVDTRDLVSNIWKINVLQALRWFLVFMPIVVLFYRENNLSMQDIMILQAIYSLTMVLCEVPSGYFSDTIGRRNSLVLGTVLGTFGFAVYSVSYSFLGFLIAEITLGIGQSFISGTDSALLYDTLCEINQEDKYIQKQGTLTATGNFSEAIAGVTGGFVALISLRTNFYIETAVMLCAIPVALAIREPNTCRTMKKRMTWSGLSDILSEAVTSPALRWLLLYSSLLAASTLTVVWFIQPYLTLVHVPLAYYGLIWTLLNGSVGIFSLTAYRIERNISGNLSLLLPLLMVFSGYMLSGSITAIWSPVFLLLMYFARGYALPVFVNHINRFVSSDRRATVLSLRVLCTRLIFIVVGPFLGWVCDTYTLQSALVFGGCLYGFTGLILLFLLRHHLNGNKTVHRGI